MAGVRARCAPDGRLVDADDLIHIFKAKHVFVRARLDARAVQVRRQAFVQNFVDQRRFSAARDTRDACHYAQRYFYVHIPQIVLRGAFDLDEMAVALTAVFRHP